MRLDTSTRLSRLLEIFCNRWNGGVDSARISMTVWRCTEYWMGGEVGASWWVDKDCGCQIASTASSHDIGDLVLTSFARCGLSLPFPAQAFRRGLYSGAIRDSKCCKPQAARHSLANFELVRGTASNSVEVLPPGDQVFAFWVTFGYS